MTPMTHPNLDETVRRIRLLILDVDGVLTDGSIILDNEGNEFKAFHVRDGHGIKMLIRAGYLVAIITGRQSKIVERRAHELGITEVYQKCFNKSEAYRRIKAKYAVADEEVAYIGDDIVDVPLLRKVGLPIAVADAATEAKAAARLVTTHQGGRGAVREVCDLILKTTGKWDELVNDYNKD